MELWSRVREHPVLTIVLVSCTAGGAVLSLELGPADLSPMRRIIGGVIAGFGVALVVIFSRAVGAFGERER